MGTHQVGVAPAEGTTLRGDKGLSERAMTRMFAVPAMVWFAVFLLVPLGVLFFVSVGARSATGGFEPALTLDSYREVGTRADAVFNTVKYSAIGTLVTFVVAYPVAYLLATKVRRGKTLLLGLIIVPFWTSMLIRTYAMIFLLGNSGIPHWLEALGFDNDLRLLNTGFAMVVGIAYNYLPLMLLPIYVTLEKIDVGLRNASKDLGATRWRTFTQVTLPLSAPGILSGCLLVSIPVMGEYLIPVLLGGGRTYFLGNTLVDLFLQSRNWPLGAAVSATFILLMCVVVVGYSVLDRRLTRGAPSNEGGML